MELQDVFLLLGGLALFLYGMNTMCANLEVAAGDRLKSVLETLTSNRLLGVLVGAGITAVIQSSSATTVMVVGFVNSGLMTLTQAVGVIMGANIGTTVTGLLIALDIGMIAPLIAFVGVALTMLSKKEKVACVGQIIAGLGILFIGMDLMSSAMAPLREYEPFIQLLTRFSNPILGILTGMIFTAIIQSSSASIGILQALAFSGLIGLDSAVYVLFGQNIGTCITAVLAALGGNRNAKRTTIIHLTFNVIGTALFTAICLLTPFVEVIQGFLPGDVPSQIAVTHVIFNITTTVVLFPFGNRLADFSRKVLPDLPTQELDDGIHLEFVDERSMGSTAIALSELRKQEALMFALAAANVEMAFDALLQRSPVLLDLVSKQEDTIDQYNAEITRCISRVSTHEMSSTDSDRFSRMLEVCSNIERIGDHAMNMAEYLPALQERKIQLDDSTTTELEGLRTMTKQALDAITFADDGDKFSMLETVSRLEKESDDRNKQYRTAQLDRMRDGGTSAELSILYSEMLTDIERLLDHTLNIAEALAGVQVPK